MVAGIKHEAGVSRQELGFRKRMDAIDIIRARNSRQ
jgi:hypothetical protein